MASSITQQVPSQVERSLPTQRNNSARNAALDFTKGALVLIMVLYHWLNYFVGASGDVFRYLRFLTPSFIFITGFLISNVHLAKYSITDSKLSKRLMQRGLKILAVFAALNLARAALFPALDREQLLSEFSSVRSMFDIFVIGNGLGGGEHKALAFFVLLPIGYLLLLSAFLLVACRYYRHSFYVALAMLMGTVVALNVNRMQSANLELVAIGLLGVILGYIPIEKINWAVTHRLFLTAAYILYLAAITVWNVVYALQIVGVCLSLMIIYLIGGPNVEPGALRRRVVLLGKYSLFGYIVQIFVLQILHHAVWNGDHNPVTLGLLFLTACALTVLAVEVTHSLRTKLTSVDRLYRAVFA